MLRQGKYKRLARVVQDDDSHNTYYNFMSDERGESSWSRPDAVGSNMLDSPHNDSANPSELATSQKYKPAEVASGNPCTSAHSGEVALP